MAGDGVWEAVRDTAPVSRPQPRGGGRGPTEGEEGHGGPEQVARRSPHVARRTARLRRTPGGRASCVLPSGLLPAHLLTCLSDPGARGGGTRGEGCGGGAPGEKRGCSEGSAPPPTGAARRRSGRYRRQGAATWRSERRRRGFTTTAAPVAAARASAPGGGRRTVRDEAASPRGAGPVTASCAAR